MIRNILLSLLVLSCTTKHPSNDTVHDKISDTTNLTQKEINAGTSNTFNTNLKEFNSEKEEFDVFFSKFNHDSIFQFSRIVFPFKMVIANIEDNRTEEYISRDEWFFLNLEYDSSVFYRDIDRYEQVIEQSSDSVMVGYRGLDNGIYFSYYFKREFGKWKLLLLEDFSN